MKVGGSIREGQVWKWEGRVCRGKGPRVGNPAGRLAPAWGQPLEGAVGDVCEDSFSGGLRTDQMTVS